MHSLQVDAVLFDLDGTLVDESESYREAIRSTAQRQLREPVTIEETLAGPRAIVGRRLTAPRLRPLIRAGRA